MIHVIQSEERLLHVLEQAASSTVVYYDFETSGLSPYTAHVLLLAIKFDQDAYVIDCTKIRNWAVLVKPFFEDTARLKVAHNAVFDYGFLFHNGIDAVPQYCTMITEQLLTAGLRGLSNSLQAVAMRRLQMPLDKTVREGFIGREIENVHFDQTELAYAATDVEVLPAIRSQQMEEIKCETMERVHQLEMELIAVTSKMELAGIDVDVEGLAERVPVFEGVRDRAKQALTDACINAGIADRILFSKDGYEAINISSPPQMLETFHRLGIDVKGTDVELLTEWDAKWAAKKQKQIKAEKASFFIDMSDQTDDTEIGYAHPFLQQFGVYKLADSILSKYIYAIPTYINPGTKKIHPRFNQCGAGATGRYSSNSPNFQNVVTKNRLKALGLEKYDIRAVFVSGPGHVFIDADFSGVELVILGCLAGDETLLKQNLEGDLHSFVGSNLFGVPFTKAMAKEYPYSIYRDVAKTTTYAIMYGSTGFNLYRKLALKLAAAGFKMTREMGDEWIAKWNALFPKTGALLETNAQKAVTKLYTESVLGRRRHWSMDDLRERNKIWAAMREGKNQPIQSSSADCTKMSELLLSKELDPKEAELVACIHDELLVRVKEEHAQKYLPVVKQCMERAGHILFPDFPYETISAEPIITTYYSK